MYVSLFLKERNKIKKEINLANSTQVNISSRNIFTTYFKISWMNSRNQSSFGLWKWEKEERENENIAYTNHTLA